MQIVGLDVQYISLRQIISRLSTELQKQGASLAAKMRRQFKMARKIKVVVVATAVCAWRRQAMGMYLGDSRCRFR